MGKSKKKNKNYVSKLPVISQKRRITVNIILASIILVFCVFSLLWPFEFISAKIKVGEGKGVNAEVTEVKEAVEVLDYVSSYLSTGSFANQTIAGSNGFFDNKYTGATLDLQDEFNLRSEDGSYFKIDNIWTLYINAEASYYVQAMKWSTYDAKTKETISWDVDMEVFTDRQVIYYKFNKYEFTYNGHINVLKNEYMGVWLECTDLSSIYEGLGTDMHNRNLLSDRYEQMKDSNDGDGFFDVNGDVYSKVLEEDNYKCKIEVDISNPQNPTMLVSADEEMQLDDSTTAKLSGEQFASIRNLNNTVIDVQIFPQYTFSSVIELLENTEDISE